MSRLRRRVEALERRLGALRLTPEAAEATLTPAERQAIGSDDPALWPLAQAAMVKVVRRCGLEALVLASYRLAAAEP